MKRLSCLLVALSAPTLLLAQARPEVQGDYIEVRSNHVYTCGCLYSGEMVTGGREAILAWDFSQHRQPAAFLDGVRVAAVLMGTDSLSLGDTPRKAYLYLDGVDSRQQQDIVQNWLLEQYPRVLGDIIGAQREAVRLEKSGGHWTVRVGEVIRLSVRGAQLPEDAHLGSQRWYDPFVPLEEPQLSTVLYDEYSGDAFMMKWRNQERRIAGFRGHFSVPLAQESR